MPTSQVIKACDDTLAQVFQQRKDEDQRTINKNRDHIRGFLWIKWGRMETDEEVRHKINSSLMGWLEWSNSRWGSEQIAKKLSAAAKASSKEEMLVTANDWDYIKP